MPTDQNFKTRRDLCPQPAPAQGVSAVVEVPAGPDKVLGLELPDSQRPLPTVSGLENRTLTSWLSPSPRGYTSVLSSTTELKAQAVIGRPPSWNSHLYPNPNPNPGHPCRTER